jgi:hypothetical protein
MTLTLRKHRITPETLALYQRAREFYDSAIPVDPGLRQYRQQACIDTALALHQALGRSPSQVCVMDTIGLEHVPTDVLCHGEAAVADWVSALALRRRLEQLSAAQRKRLPGPTAIGILGMIVVTPRRVSRRSSPFRVYGLLQLLNIWLSLCLV